MNLGHLHEVTSSFAGRTNAQGYIVWFKYPLSTLNVYVSNLSLNTSSACQITMLNRDYYSMLKSDGSVNGYLKVGTKNTGSTTCQPRLMMAKMWGRSADHRPAVTRVSP